MITRLRARNFKSLRDTKLELGLRNVLVGPNMSGKSNVLDVFKFLTHMVTPEPGMTGVATAFSKRLGFQEVAWKGSDPREIRIAIEGKLPSVHLDGQEYDLIGDAHSWEYEISFVILPHGSARLDGESLVLDFGLEKKPLIEVESASGKRRLLNRDGNKLSEIDDWGRSALEFEIPDWDGNLIRSLIRRWRFYQLSPLLMRNLNPTAAANVLSEHGENISAWLMTLQTRYRDSFGAVLQCVRDVFPEVKDIFAWTTEQSTVFASSQERALKRPTSLWQMSDGEMVFIALLSLIFSPVELGAPLYCVEEPENHLHPKLMETLVSLLDQRQLELKEQSAQIILATHSPHVLDHFTLDDVVVVEKRDGATICTRPNTKPHLRELLTKEEAGLGQLYYSGSLGSD